MAEPVKEGAAGSTASQERKDYIYTELMTGEAAPVSAGAQCKLTQSVVATVSPDGSAARLRSMDGPSSFEYTSYENSNGRNAILTIDSVTPMGENSVRVDLQAQQKAEQRPDFSKELERALDAHQLNTAQTNFQANKSALQGLGVVCVENGTEVHPYLSPRDIANVANAAIPPQIRSIPKNTR